MNWLSTKNSPLFLIITDTEIGPNQFSQTSPIGCNRSIEAFKNIHIHIQILSFPKENQ